MPSGLGLMANQRMLIPVSRPEDSRLAKVYDHIAKSAKEYLDSNINLGVDVNKHFLNFMLADYYNRSDVASEIGLASTEVKDIVEELVAKGYLTEAYTYHPEVNQIFNSRRDLVKIQPTGPGGTYQERKLYHYVKPPESQKRENTPLLTKIMREGLKPGRKTGESDQDVVYLSSDPHIFDEGLPATFSARVSEKDLYRDPDIVSGVPLGSDPIGSIRKRVSAAPLHSPWLDEKLKELEKADEEKDQNKINEIIHKMYTESSDLDYDAIKGYYVTKSVSPEMLALNIEENKNNPNILGKLDYLANKFGYSHFYSIPIKFVRSTKFVDAAIALYGSPEEFLEEYSIRREEDSSLGTNRYVQILVKEIEKRLNNV